MVSRKRQRNPSSILNGFARLHSPGRWTKPFICRTEVHLVQDTGQSSEEAEITEKTSIAATQENLEVPEVLSLNLESLSSGIQAGEAFFILQETINWCVVKSI